MRSAARSLAWPLRKPSSHQQRPFETRICKRRKSAKVRCERGLANPIPGKALIERPSQTLEQTGCCHDAPTPDDALGRPAEHQRRREFTEVASHQFEDCRLIRECPVGSEPACNGRSCG